jgi:hypothetical protein
MRIVRRTYGYVWYPHHPHHLERPEVVNFTGESAIEMRILFNRFETKLIGAALWVLNTWVERVMYPILRQRCRWLGKHGAACRGRTGHY